MKSVSPILVFVVVVVGTQLVGFTIPNNFTWGIHSFGFLPPSAFILYIGLAVVVTGLAMSGRLSRLISVCVRLEDRRPVYFVVLAIAGFVAGALLLRIKVPLLGDSFFIVKNLSESLHGTRPLLLRNEPLATRYFSAVISVIRPKTYGGFLNAFLISELILGIGFVVNIFFIVRHLFQDGRARVLTLGLVFAIPYIQLFLGYIEIYAAVLFSISLYVLLAVLFLRRKVPFVLPVIGFVLAALSHYLAVLIGASLVYLGWLEWKRRGMKPVVIGIATGIVLILGFLAAEGFEFDRLTAPVPYSHFLQLNRDVDHEEAYSAAYSLFSSYHALDLLNYLLLMSVAIMFLFAIAYRRDRMALFASDDNRFFASAVAPVAAFLLVVKFDLGPAKDWDVLASYFLIGALLAASCFFRRRDNENDFRVGQAVVAVTLLTTLGYLSLNAASEPAIRRYRSLLDSRTLAQGAFYTASQHLAFYYHQVRAETGIRAIDTGALKSWERYASEFPSDPRGYRNIIVDLTLVDSEATEKIADVYERWIARIPDDTEAVQSYSGFCITAGNRLFARSELGIAAQYYRRAVALDSTRAEAFNNLGSVYAERGNRDTAVVFFRRAIELDSAYSDPYYNLAMAYQDRGEHAQAEGYFKLAARLGNAAAQDRLRQQQTR